MGLQKICPRCRSAIIPAQDKLCTRCAEHKSIRHMEYDAFRRDKKCQAFYHSKEWTDMRNFIIETYGDIDVYMMHVYGIAIPATTVHHIVPLQEDWSRRLDPDNLIQVAHETHSAIHKLYQVKKRKTQRLLEDANRIHRHKKGGGLN
mgnify:CR=1 FL=1